MLADRFAKNCKGCPGEPFAGEGEFKRILICDVFPPDDYVVRSGFFILASAGGDLLSMGFED